MILLTEEQYEEIAKQYGIEDEQIIEQSNENIEKFKKEIKDAIMNVVKSIKIDISK